ncbi:MAG TPA: glycosyltransferase family 2 protein [Polyangiaceae bacterium]
MPALAASSYLAALACLSGENEKPRAPVAWPRLDVIVPAHDEEANVAATVESLLSADYPTGSFRVVVVADNCSDATAARAAAAGADVIERVDAERRGKGFALARAFEETLARGEADAVVVVDADTRVSKNLLRAMAARLAAGEVAVQAEYGVRNPESSWRTRLMVLAFALFHTLRSRARERVGVSCGLRGNGMAFATSVLREVPYDAFSIVEDVEYGIALGRAGHRVAYAGEATVMGEMPSTSDAARSQRQRWERGRRALVRAVGPKLLARAVAKRSALELDLAADLLVPPLSTLVLWIALGVIVSTVARLPIAFVAWSLAAVATGAYVARGASIAGLGVRAVRDLAWAPIYVAWKLAVPARRPDEWIRTAREKTK